MKTRSYLAVIVFSIIGLVSGFAQTTATNFRMPFSGTLTQTQNHFLWEPFTLNGKTVDGFHAGEDWSDSGLTGKTLMAIADGTVVRVGYSDSFGNYVRVKYQMPYGQTLYSDYSHCRKVTVSQGQSVSKGKSIAELGNTGNSTGAHLHWAMVRDSSIIPTINPYYGGIGSNGVSRTKLSPEIGLQYVSPSLVVSDWEKQKIVTGTPYKLSTFTMDKLIPGWMIYVKDSSGKVMTLSSAVSAGVLNYGILRRDGSKWLYYTDPNQSFVIYDEEYAIYPKQYCELFICNPDFDLDSIRDRALQDVMLAGRNLRYKYLADGTNFYRYNSTSTAHHHAGVFINASGGVSVLYQLTHKSAPMVRMVFPYNLVNGKLVQSSDPQDVNFRAPSY